MLRTFIALILETAGADLYRQNMKKMASLCPDYAVKYSRVDPFGAPWREFFIDPTRDKKLSRDISRARQLYTHSVIAFLGAGSEGIAFELDDGSVLKLGQMHMGIRHDRPRLVSVPWKYRDRSTSDKNDMKIHDLGRAHVNTEKLTPFFTFIEGFSAQEKWFLERICDKLRAYVVTERMAGRRPDVYAYNISSSGFSHRIQDVVRGIIDAYAAAADGRSIDLHPGNLGFRPSDGMFVFYDF